MRATLRRRRLYSPWSTIEIHAQSTIRSSGSTFASTYGKSRETIDSFRVDSNDYLVFSTAEIESFKDRKVYDVKVSHAHMPIFTNALREMREIMEQVFEEVDGGVWRYVKTPENTRHMKGFMDGRGMLLRPCVSEYDDNMGTQDIDSDEGIPSIALHLSKTIFGISTRGDFFAFCDFFQSFSLHAESGIAEMLHHQRMSSGSQGRSVSSPPRPRGGA